MTIFYGKEYHNFVCIKTGEVIKQNLTDGTGIQSVDLSVPDCLEYKDVESETLKGLNL